MADERPDASLMRRRLPVFVPFALLFLVTLFGGQVNRVDARGVVIDSSTQQPVPGVSITFSANRGAVSDDQGGYFIANLPLDAHLRTSAPGYPPVTAAELPPLPDAAPKVPFWKMVGVVERLRTSYQRIPTRASATTLWFNTSDSWSPKWR